MSAKSHTLSRTRGDKEWGVLHTIALEAITTSRYPFATGEWRRHFKMLGCTRGLSPSGISAIWINRFFVFLKYKEIAERFSFLSDVPHNVTSSSTNTERYFQCCRKLIDAYTQRTSTVMSQLSFSSFIHMCSISSVQKKKKKKKKKCKSKI